MKKISLYLLTIFALQTISYSQDFTSDLSTNKEAISKYIQLSPKQLIDTADHYNYTKNYYNTALICYNILISTIPKTADFEEQKILVDAYNKSAIIYGAMSDYSTAYDLFLKALLICEKYHFVDYKSRIYSNIGNIYSFLNQYDISNQYYLKALDLCNDSTNMILLLNNLGANEMARGKLDDAFYYINKSIAISKRHDDFKLYNMLNNMGCYYQHKKQYDSASYYFQLSLFHSRINNMPEVEANNLSDLGKLFFELNNIDSSQYYIDLSNKIAKENKFLKNMADNYLILTEIEKSKGRYKKSLEYHITYMQLKDSINNMDIFGDINQLQRQYEISKTNQQIEELVIDRQIKEKTIQYQKVIQKIVVGVLISLIIVLFVIVYQNKKLRRSYKVLFDTNIEFIKLHKKSSDKNKTNANQLNSHDELMSKILAVMEDASIYCDTSFAINNLATLTQSNTSYVSRAIKNNLNKNFRSFLNSYRIREAQKIFMDFDVEKYSIEYVSEKVGFKSRSGFFDAFKEVTGVSPTYYLKSMQKQEYHS